MSYAHKKHMRQGQEIYAKPNITSFADVVLTLLIIVLVSTTAALHMVQVTPPDARHRVSRDPNLAVNLTVDKDGKFYWEDLKTPVQGKDLWTFLRQTKGDHVWRVAMVRADKDAPADRIALAAQCLQGLGVDEVAFVVEAEKEAP